MTDIFLKLLNISFSASLLIAACIIIRYIAKGMPKYMRCILWLLVLVRLACPFHLESPFSLLPQKEMIGYSQTGDSVRSGDSYKTDKAFSPTLSTSSGTSVNPKETLSDTVGTKSEVEQDAPSIEYAEQDVSVKNASAKQSTSSSGDSLLSIRKSNLIIIFAVIWIMGIIAAALYGFISYVRLVRCVGDAVLLRDNIYQSERVSTPFVLGIFRTRIYIPYNLSKSELFFVLSHERAHISRKDHMLKPVAYIISCIYWFNPLVWISYSLLCRDIELACDEKAMRQIGYNKKKEYSQSILDLSVPRRYITACPVAFGETDVKERVRSVLGMKKGKKIAVVISALVIVAVGVGFLTYPKAKNNDNKKAVETTAEDVVKAASATEVAESDEVDAKKTDETAKENAADETTETVEKAADKSEESTEVADSNIEELIDEDAPAAEGDQVPEEVIAPENEEVDADDVYSVNLDDQSSANGSEIKVVVLKNQPDGSVSIDENVVDAPKTEPGESSEVTIVYTPGDDLDDVPIEATNKSLYDVVDSDSITVTRLYSDEHKGIDIVARPGSDIKSFKEGTVKASGFDKKNGNYIEIEDSEGNVYSYYHMQDLPTLKAGDSVKEGQVIGKLGNTGESTGPHLHFAVSDKNGVPHDIAVYTSDYYYEED